MKLVQVKGGPSSLWTPKAAKGLAATTLCSSKPWDRTKVAGCICCAGPPAPSNRLRVDLLGPSSSLKGRSLTVTCRASAEAIPGDGASGGEGVDQVSVWEKRLGDFCGLMTRGFPLWVILAALSGFYMPHLYTWFGTTHTTVSLMLVMLGMGITLTFDEIGAVFTKTPQLLILGMVLQYTIMPALGFAISRYWGLTASLAAGVALVSCMPGGTASNIVAYIARGEMPLSVMMTTASTLMAVVTTPLLTSLLVGTLVNVDAGAMFLSTLQLVLAPVLLGAAANQYLPKITRRLSKFAPFFATVLVVMIVGSMIGRDVAVVRESGYQIISAVAVLHGSAFFIGYFVSRALGLSGKLCRTISIEVGMQSSALAAVLAKLHFNDPVVVAPCVLSACTHAMLGSLLAGYWNLTAKD